MPVRIADDFEGIRNVLKSRSETIGDAAPRIILEFPTKWHYKKIETDDLSRQLSVVFVVNPSTKTMWHFDESKKVWREIEPD